VQSDICTPRQSKTHTNITYNNIQKQPTALLQPPPPPCYRGHHQQHSETTHSSITVPSSSLLPGPSPTIFRNNPQLYYSPLLLPVTGAITNSIQKQPTAPLQLPPPPCYRGHHQQHSETTDSSMTTPSSLLPGPSPTAFRNNPQLHYSSLLLPVTGAITNNIQKQPTAPLQLPPPCYRGHHQQHSETTHSSITAPSSSLLPGPSQTTFRNNRQLHYSSLLLPVTGAITNNIQKQPTALLQPPPPSCYRGHHQQHSEPTDSSITAPSSSLLTGPSPTAFRNNRQLYYSPLLLPVTGAITRTFRNNRQLHYSSLLLPVTGTITNSIQKQPTPPLQLPPPPCYRGHHQQHYFTPTLPERTFAPHRTTAVTANCCYVIISSVANNSRFDVHESVHRDTNMKVTNKMQLCRLIYYSKSALHVSGDVFAHHQGHLTVFTVSGSIHQSSCRYPAHRIKAGIGLNSFKIHANIQGRVERGTCQLVLTH